MEYSVTSGAPEKQRTACLILGVFEPHTLSTAAAAVDQAGDGFLSALIKRGDISGRLGQTLLLPQTPGLAWERILLVGCGKAEELNETRYNRILASTAAALDQTGAGEAVSYLPHLDVTQRDIAWRIRQSVLVTEQTRYCFDRLKSKKKEQKSPTAKIVFGVSGRKEQNAAEQAVLHGAAIASGVTLARDLGNLPGNHCTPRFLAEQAKALSKQHKKLKIKILDETELEKLGAGSLLSVSKGSVEPPRLIVLEYRNGPSKQKPFALVGKGVTFDTGGISIKPAAAMDEMKYDMCGAASVLGTLQACAVMELPLNVVGIIAAVENMPSGSASKPGDVVTSLSGQTIEILNTDAEGRLILCDALTYSEKFKPQAVIDIATLTGACVIALGGHAHGLFSKHDKLSEQLLGAGFTAFDRAWRMPVWDEYQDALDSNFADMANVGGREAGAVTAACFLARFSEKLNWAHLDIAGTAWKSGKEKGATGRPVPLLTQYLLDRAAEQ